MGWKTFEQKRSATTIPENVETRDVLQRLLLNLIDIHPDEFTPDRLKNIMHG